MPEPKPLFLQDLPEVEKTSTNDDVVEVEAQAVATTLRELQNKFGVVLIVEGMGKTDEQAIENLDEALLEFTTKYGLDAIKGKAIYLQPKKIDEELEKETRKDREPGSIIVIKDDSPEDMFRDLEIASLMPEFLKKMKLMDTDFNITIKFDPDSLNINLETLKNITRAINRSRIKLDDYEFPGSIIEIVDDKSELKKWNKKSAEKKYFNFIYFVQWNDSAEEMRADLMEIYQQEKSLDDKDDLERTTDELPEYS